MNQETPLSPTGSLTITNHGGGSISAVLSGGSIIGISDVFLRDPDQKVITIMGDIYRIADYRFRYVGRDDDRALTLVEWVSGTPAPAWWMALSIPVGSTGEIGDPTWNKFESLSGALAYFQSQTQWTHAVVYCQTDVPVRDGTDNIVAQWDKDNPAPVWYLRASAAWGGRDRIGVFASEYEALHGWGNWEPWMVAAIYYQIHPPMNGFDQGDKNYSPVYVWDIVEMKFRPYTAGDHHIAQRDQEDNGG